MLFIISAPSAAGKTTIVRELIRRVPGLARLTTATTRAPRDDEEDGKDYTFLSEQAFVRMIHSGELVEWKKTYGNYYGVPKAAVEEAIRSSSDFVIILDVYGREEFRRRWPSCVSIFIAPSDVRDLRERLAGRTDCPQEELEARASRIDEELAFAPSYDHIVVNESVDQAVAEIAEIIARYRATLGPEPRPPHSEGDPR
ncbi:MAG: guanylate kinase [Firmicutes bacterium]|nr:guanylate kinase [Bacillota bacterium]MDH7495927.1 guanylate kinase [Bacillota bacterium]